MSEIIEDQPSDRQIHVILDNYCTHKKNETWLAAHPNVAFHFTPTSASWLNQVEIWFGIFTRKALSGASFRSAEQLKQAIQDFTAAYNQHAAPFVWRKREVKARGRARDGGSPPRQSPEHARRRREPALAKAGAYDVAEFVADLREYKVTPHVAQNTTNRWSAIDGRTTRHSGYAVSGRVCKRIEEVFGWTKAAAGFRKTAHRAARAAAGLPDRRPE